MMINKENYELYALDYLEGNLDEVVVKEMRLFLDHHPSVKSELELMGPLPTMAMNKEIVYNDKENLKRRSKKVVPWFGYIVKYAAAVIILLALFALWFINQNEQQSTLMSDAAEFPQSTEELKTVPVSPPIAETTPMKSDHGPSTSTDNSKTTIGNIVSPKSQVSITPDRMVASTVATATPQINIDEPPVQLVSPSPTPLEVTAAIKVENVEKAETMAEATRIASVTLLSLDRTFNEKLSIPQNMTAAAIAETQDERNKGSWLLNAITKKSDGTKIFALAGVKRALTPSRYRDEIVDKSSTDSPIKKLTND